MFKKAEREQAKLKIALTGVSGSGKTYSSLLIARGLVGEKGKIAVIDTENNSASLYANITEYDVLNIEAPFTVEKYTMAINEAVKQGYEVVIVDSLSHAWKQILTDKEQLDAKGGNSFVNWGKMTPKHEAFISALTQSNIHLIGTMRSKTEYLVEQNDKGKTMPRKVGLAPVQREGMEYEFTVVLDVASPSHLAEASKDRTGLFDGKIFIPTIETGSTLKDWLLKGKEIEKPKGDLKKIKEVILKSNAIDDLNKIMEQVNLRVWSDLEHKEIIKDIDTKQKSFNDFER